VVGVDEAGRGPLAGPVVTAACCFDRDARVAVPADVVLDDSKAMSRGERERAFEWLVAEQARGAVLHAVKVVEPGDIDTRNILQATLWGMDECVRELRARGACDHVLVDGPHLPPRVKAELLPGARAEAVVGGDARVRAIAAASVIAKVTRDRIMQRMHAAYPAYGFDEHVGYPTPHHRRMLAEHGPCPIHRMSFRTVREAAERRRVSQGGA